MNDYYNFLEEYRYTSLEKNEVLRVNRYQAAALEAEGVVANAVYPKTKRALVKVTLTEEGFKKVKRDLEFAEYFFDIGYDCGRNQPF